MRVGDYPALVIGHEQLTKCGDVKLAEMCTIITRTVSSQEVLEVLHSRG